MIEIMFCFINLLYILLLFEFSFSCFLVLIQDHSSNFFAYTVLTFGTKQWNHHKKKSMFAEWIKIKTKLDICFIALEHFYEALGYNKCML